MNKKVQFSYTRLPIRAQYMRSLMVAFSHFGWINEIVLGEQDDWAEADLFVAINEIPDVKKLHSKRVLYINFEDVPSDDRMGKRNREFLKLFGDAMRVFKPDIFSLDESSIYSLEQFERWCPNFPKAVFLDAVSLYNPNFQIDYGNQRKRDSIFFGSVTPERNLMLAGLKYQGCHIEVANGWEERKIAILNQFKISISLFVQDERCLKSHRAIDSIMCGCLYVTPFFDAPSSLEKGKHFVMCDLKKMPEVISYYLNHEKERRAIVIEAQQYIAENMSNMGYVGKLIKLLEEMDNEKHSVVPTTD